MASTTFYAQRDSFMRYTDADANFGSAGFIGVLVAYYVGSKTLLDRTIVNFDVSSLSGQIINEAKLVRVRQGRYGPVVAATVKRCTRPATWTEAGVTWNKYDGTNNWTGGGGDMDSTTPTPISYLEDNGDNPHTITGLKGFVDDALNNRSGIVSLILKLDDEDPGASRGAWYDSKETSPGTSPRLEVTYGITVLPQRITQLKQAVNRASTY